VIAGCDLVGIEVLKLPLERCEKTVLRLFFHILNFYVRKQLYLSAFHTYNAQNFRDLSLPDGASAADFCRCALEVCGSTISATRPVPVADLLTRTRTRPAPKISTLPDPTRSYTRTRSLP